MLYNGRCGLNSYPFILLNLPIAAKRSDAIASELAKHTFEIDRESLEITCQIHDLTKKINVLAEIMHAHVAGDATTSTGATV